MEIVYYVTSPVIRFLPGKRDSYRARQSRVRNYHASPVNSFWTIFVRYRSSYFNVTYYLLRKNAFFNLVVQDKFNSVALESAGALPNGIVHEYCKNMFAGLNPDVVNC